MRSTTWLVAALVTAAAGCRDARPAATLDGVKGSFVIQQAGLSAPQAVFHDQLMDVYFVSNVTAPRDGGTGFVSVLSPAGEVMATRWIDGAVSGVTLRSPRGMAAAGDHLFVLDGGEIRRFERSAGTPVDSYTVPGAVALTGITASFEGWLYFTDAGVLAGADTLLPSGTDAVFRLTSDGTLTALARGSELGHPTAVALWHDTVWVGNRRGEIYRLQDGRRAAVHRAGRAAVTGLVVLNGDAFIATADGSLYRGPVGGPYDEIVRGVEAPSAISLDPYRMRVLVPMGRANALGVIPLIDPDIMGFTR